MTQDQSSTETAADIFNRMFEALPPLDSAQYLELLENATAADLPAQVLARAYRHLCAAGCEAAANATLARLVGSGGRYGYLASLRRLAFREVACGQYWYDADDLMQAAIIEIVKTLPTPRGDLAERAWVLFIHQRFQDGWRELNGRRGEKIRGVRVEPTVDQGRGEVFDPIEETDGATAPWHVRAEASNLPWLDDFIRKTVAKIADPQMRRVAEDQFGDDPSPISAGRSAGGKLPLTEQLGENRFKIYRLRDNAKARLAAALRAQRQHEIDAEWLRRFLQ
jgi:DNA-directed RNA polymerase specialized sigma24 family protein